MPALIIPGALSPQYKAQAWCEDCQDGRNGGKVMVQKWAIEHNLKEHPNG